MKTISIIGCGWLGTPLAFRLLQEGYAVKGSTTRADKLPSLKDIGIAPYLISLNPDLQGQKTEEFLEADVLVISIPPRVQKHGEDYHPRQIEAILKAIEKHLQLRVLYTSSTSVYPTEGLDLPEEAAHTAAEGANQTLLKAEALLQEALGNRLTILRCGGLMGYDRISGKWSKGAAVADTPVNYLHRDDAVAIILQLIEQEKWGRVYNAVSPEHPSRAAIYQKNAAAFGWPPAATVETSRHKTISPRKLQEELGYSFIYPNPLDFSYSAN
jgi:nucleoside-diphosphate-sugar epimerase